MADQTNWIWRTTQLVPVTPGDYERVASDGGPWRWDDCTNMPIIARLLQVLEPAESTSSKPRWWTRLTSRQRDDTWETYRAPHTRVVGAVPAGCGLVAAIGDEPEPNSLQSLGGWETVGVLPLEPGIKLEDHEGQQTDVVALLLERDKSGSRRVKLGVKINAQIVAAPDYDMKVVWDDAWSPDRAQPMNELSPFGPPRGRDNY